MVPVHHLTLGDLSKLITQPPKSQTDPLAGVWFKLETMFSLKKCHPHLIFPYLSHGLWEVRGGERESIAYG